jgi:hypothetical protein
MSSAYRARSHTSEKTVLPPVNGLIAGTELVCRRSLLTSITRSCVVPFQASFHEISG